MSARALGLALLAGPDWVLGSAVAGAPIPSNPAPAISPAFCARFRTRARRESIVRRNFISLPSYSLGTNPTCYSSSSQVEHAAIERDIRASEKAGRIGAEIDRQTRNLFGPRHSAHRLRL